MTTELQWPLKTRHPLEIKARVRYGVRPNRRVDYALSYQHLWELVDTHGTSFVEFMSWQFNIRNHNDAIPGYYESVGRIRQVTDYNRP